MRKTVKKQLNLKKLNVATLNRLETITGGTMTTCGTMGGDTAQNCTGPKSWPKTLCPGEC